MDDPGFFFVRCLFSVSHLIFLFTRHYFHTAMLGCVSVCVSSLNPSMQPFFYYFPSQALIPESLPGSPQSLGPLPLECTQSYLSSDSFTVCV